MQTRTILAIETSCDETAVAVLRTVENGNRKSENRTVTTVEVLSSAIASQVDIHKETGGVVPNVAAREHAKVIAPLISRVIEQAAVKGEDLDGIAVTVGPGLMPALSVGVQAARTLALTWNVPIIPVHHIEAHVYSALFLPQTPTTYNLPPTTYPSLALIVSGGHTMLIKLSGPLQYKILGQTRDDAAGEVFDKVARMLDLPYPGGPQISQLAREGDEAAFDFPRPMQQSDDLDFSFSGLKTAVLYELREIGSASRRKKIEDRKSDISASFQVAVVDSLIGKTKQALHQNGYKALILAGGVAANTALREKMKELADEEQVELYTAPLELCGDNAVMIGQVGLLALEAGRVKSWRDIEPIARVSIESFSD